MTPPTTTKPLTIEQEKQQVWHAAAFDGIRAELYEDLDNLEFFQEEQLNQEPLRLDILVIKKKPGVTLKKNFARMFKGHNIIEYKSPDDSLNIEAYLKAIGCTCLYQALRKEVGYDDVTLTLICTKHPRELLKFLNSKSHKISEEYPGIYKIAGENFPVQILESKKLSGNDNLWLRNLRKDAEEEELEKLLLLNNKVLEKVKLENYWNTVTAVNKNFKEKVINMTYADIERNLDEMFGLKKRMAESKTEGFNHALDVVKNLMRGIPPKQIAEEHGRSVEEIEQIQREILSV